MVFFPKLLIHLIFLEVVSNIRDNPKTAEII